MRIFASDRVKNFMQALGMEKGEAIEHRMVTNAIEKAQRKVEGRNFDIRKQLLEYDDVANDQRQIVYQQRDDLLVSEDISETIMAIRADVVNDTIDGYIQPMSVEEQWDIAGLENSLKSYFAVELPIQQWLDQDNTVDEDAIRERALAAVQSAYETKCEAVGPDMRKIEKQVMLQILDQLWKDHLATMDQLRQGIHLRAYAQKYPKQEYKREYFELFQTLLNNLKFEVIKFLSHVQIQRPDEAERIEQQRRDEAAREQLAFEHSDASALREPAASAEQDPSAAPFVREERKVGRNEPCPCGSGKKYKSCHGKL